MSSSLLNSSIPSMVASNNMISSTAGATGAGSSTVQPQQQVISNLAQFEQTSSETQQLLQNFWQKQMEDIQNTTVVDFKVQELPLARIKKIMKMDEDVKMISAEAPLLFAKAAQMFITELSLRAWIHTEENKRRTLQRNDIATAITKFDQFDFLIDIVPREELKPARRATEESRVSGETLQYFYTLPQQQTQPQQQPQTTVNVQNTTSTTQANQIILAPGSQLVQIATPGGQLLSGDGNTQILQLASQQQSQQNNGTNAIVVGGNTQHTTNVPLVTQQEQQQTQTINPNILQQLIANSGVSPGEIHSIQINSDGQMQLIRLPPASSDSLQDQEQQQNQTQVVGITADDASQELFGIPAST